MGRRSIALMLYDAAFLAAACSSQPKQAPASTTNAAGPLAEYLGGLMPDQDDPERDAKDHAVQEKVAACMKAQVFEYVPVDSAGTTVGMGTRPVQGDRPWTEKYGYGISTTEAVVATPSRRIRTRRSAKP